MPVLAGFKASIEVTLAALWPDVVTTLNFLSAPTLEILSLSLRLLWSTAFLVLLVSITVFQCAAIAVLLPAEAILANLVQGICYLYYRRFDSFLFSYPILGSIFIFYFFFNNSIANRMYNFCVFLSIMYLCLYVSFLRVYFPCNSIVCNSYSILSVLKVILRFKNAVNLICRFLVYLVC